MFLHFKNRLSTFIENARGFKTTLILFPYIILIAVGVYVAYQKCAPIFVKDGAKYTRKSICGDIMLAEKLPTSEERNEKKVEARVYTDSDASYWEIMDTSKDPHFPTGLKVYGKNLPSPIVRWNNFLLAVNQEHYIDKSGRAFFGSPASDRYTLQSLIRTIRAYNIETGEAFDISLDKPTWGEIWYVASQVVDDTYYFGVGGAYGASLGYKLDLPPQRSSRITKLKTPVGGAITKYGSIYVSKSCYEGCTYSLFNPSSLTTSPLQRMVDASNRYMLDRKEELLGIDSQGRMIINVRDISKDNDNQATFDTESIAAVPLTDEKSTITLLKAAELPEKTHKYFMIDGIDKIILLGASKIYIYDIKTSNFTEFQVGENNQARLSLSNVTITKTDKAVCVADVESVKFAIDLTTETYLDTPPSDCSAQYAEKSQEDIFKDLNLPDYFEFAYTPVVYKTYNVVTEIPESELPENSEIINVLEN